MSRECGQNQGGGASAERRKFSLTADALAVSGEIDGVLPNAATGERVLRLD